jgi:hypothetical protein
VGLILYLDGGISGRLFLKFESPIPMEHTAPKKINWFAASKFFTNETGKPGKATLFGSVDGDTPYGILGFRPFDSVIRQEIGWIDDNRGTRTAIQGNWCNSQGTGRIYPEVPEIRYVH